MRGNKGEALANWVAGESLAEAELSDLQRAEAHRLMARRGVEKSSADNGLLERLQALSIELKPFRCPTKRRPMN